MSDTPKVVKLADQLRALHTLSRKKAAYGRRIILVSVEDECDSGADIVATVRLSRADLHRLIEGL